MASSLARKEAELGAVLGALVGDAAGATLEFKRNISRQDVEVAMRMPGGGELDVGPGQITDDGELTLALLGAITGNDNETAVDIDRVARAFCDWHRSRPFDMGSTCGRAFASLAAVPTAAAMRANAERFSALSEANGALMRATPVPAVLHRLSNDRVADVARRAAGLSHPNPVCLETAALYSVAIAHLIRTASEDKAARAAGAVALVEELAAAWDAPPAVRAWISDSARPLEAIDCCRVNIGHVKHGFTLALHFLRACSGYEDAVRETLARGGDTDTNAAIVGGMIGALHGRGGIPAYMLDPVMRFDPTAATGGELVDGVRVPGQPRPAAYRAAGIMDILG